MEYEYPWLRFVGHYAYSYLLRMMESCFYGYGNHNIFYFKLCFD